MKNKLFSLLGLSVLLLSCKQDNKNATQRNIVTDVFLEHYLEVAYNDSLTKEVRFESNAKAMAIVSKMKNDSLTRVYYFRIANRFWNMDAEPYYDKINKIIVQKAMSAHDDHALAKVYDYIGDSFNHKGIRDSAYFYFDKSEKTYIRLKDTTNMALAILGKALNQYKAYDFIGTQKNVYKAIKLLQNPKTDKEKETLMAGYNLLGTTNDDLKNYQLSISYYKKCEAISKTMKDTLKSHYHALFANNIGCAYQNADDNLGALPYFKDVMKDRSLPYEMPIIYTQVLSNYAYAKLKTGDMSELPGMFIKARHWADSLKSWPTYSNASLSLSEYYSINRKPAEAIVHAKKAYAVARQNKAFREVFLSLLHLAKLDQRNAGVYLSTYIHVKDSLQSLERINPDKFARIEYQVDVFKEQQRHIRADRDKVNKNLTIMIILFVFLLLISAIFYLMIAQKTKSKSLEFIKEQQRTNDELYKLMSDQQQMVEEGKQVEKRRIAHELHDGIMGKLSGIRLNLSVLTKKPDSDTIPKCIEYISDIQEVEKELRTIAYDLEKSLFSGVVNFETVVQNLFIAIESHSSINFSLKANKNIDWELVNNNTKMQIYRIMQEALNNIDKYAQARNVEISMDKQNNAVIIRITDDGIGFDSEKVNHGIGLKSMAARAQAINGKLTVTSESTLGTSICLVFQI